MKNRRRKEGKIVSLSLAQASEVSANIGDVWV